MAIDISLLKKHGISSGNYKRIFDGDAINYPPKIKKLVDWLAGHNRDGISMGLREWRAHAAVDLAYEVSFNQTTPTLVQNILSKQMDAAGTLAALNEWGLSESELLMDVPNAAGQMVKVLNPPVFFQLFVPIVKAYLSNVEGQIYNERNQSPLLPYNPLKETTRNRVLCDLHTDLIETVSTNCGYSAVLRQSIHQMLKYGVMIAFPREEWYCEEQLQDDGSEKGKTFTVKEGLRYTHPHPTKMAYDLKHPLTSLNTDTGTEWLLHWHPMSYGEVYDNRMLWNRQRIFAGTNWFHFEGSEAYWKEIFPCRVSYPTNTFKPPDREDKSAWYSNSASGRDQSVFVVEQFAKINPKEWGLGRYENKKLVDTYNYPVWHRFKMAGDDTVLWAEPCAYTPAWMMAYDYDGMAGVNSSLGLELIPWQDHLGMVLSQMGLTARQNLMNCIFYDNQIVDKADIEKLQNSGEKKYRGINFISFDSLKRRMAQTDINRAFIPVQLSKTPIGELYSLIGTILNMMDRVLGVSTQEAGAAASHQQSKEEVIRTGAASGSRRALTAACCDEGTDAWKRQLHDGYQAYGDAGVALQVSAEIEDVEKHLDALGFTIETRDGETLMVKGRKQGLKLEAFARSGDGPERKNEKEIAQVLFQVVGTISGQPELFQKIGSKALLALLEEGARLAGARKDFKLVEQKQTDNGQVPPQFVELLKQVQGTILQEVATKIAEPAAKQMSQQESQIAQMQQTLKQLEGIYKVASAQQDKVEVLKTQAAAKTQIRAAEAAAAEQRKQQEHEAKLRRDQEEAAVKLEIEKQKAVTEQAIDLQSAHSDTAIKKEESAAKKQQTPKTQP